MLPSRYMNHALGHLLEHLLDLGISSISCIGGQSRVAELDAFNLRNISITSPKTRNQNYILRSAHR